MPKPRKVISYIDLYEKSKKNELDKLRGEFGDKVIDVALNNYLVGIVVAIEKYHCWRSSLECFKAIPLIRYYVFEASDEELKKASEEDVRSVLHRYNSIRAFINKERDKILRKFKRQCSPPEDLERYMEVFSGMARECVEFCLEKFRGEIDNIREMEKEEAFEEMIERSLRAAEENKDNLKSAAAIRRGERKTFVERLQEERGERREGGVSISDDENIDDVNGSKVKWSV
jgi:hypothetical protein